MKKQLFEYLKYSFEYNHSYRMPIPMVNILNGGKRVKASGDYEPWTPTS